MVAFAVAERRFEMAVRLALGASSGRVLRVLLGRVAAALSAGLLAGMLVSVWAGRWIGALLYDVRPHDPATFAAALALLLCVSALAASWPARRALSTDPAVVLRAD